MVDNIDKKHIVGHRGAGNTAPPNTIAALEKAVEMELEWVEFDVYVTSDDRLVVAHEGDLSKLLGSDIKVSENSFEVLKEIDLAKSFKGASGEAHMPLFEDVLQFCVDNGLRAQIELKAKGEDARELAQAVMAVMDQDKFDFPEGKEPMISSFEVDALKAIKEASSGRLKTGLLIHTHENGDWKKNADAAGADYVHFYGGVVEEGRRLPEEYAEEVRAAGYKLNAFKVNTVEDAVSAIKAGVERFTSDEPAVLLGLDASELGKDVEHEVDTFIIPVGGYGTRMGLITKSIPKAMLPVGEKPLIMHAVEEALEAGAKRIIIPCRPSDANLFGKQFYGDDPFSRGPIIDEDHQQMILKGFDPLKDIIEVVPIYAKEGPASTIAKLVLERDIGNFGVILPDDLIVGEVGAMKQMVDCFSKTGMSTIGARQVDERDQHKNVTFIKMEERGDGTSITTTIQIKPDEDPISKNATSGRYIFTDDYVDVVEAIDKDGLKEVSMSAVVRHYAQNEGIGVVELDNCDFYDCGDMVGYYHAIASFIPQDILIKEFMSNNPEMAIVSTANAAIKKDGNDNKVNIKESNPDFDNNEAESDFDQVDIIDIIEETYDESIGYDTLDPT